MVRGCHNQDLPFLLVPREEGQIQLVFFFLILKKVNEGENNIIPINTEVFCLFVFCKAYSSHQNHVRIQWAALLSEEGHVPVMS